MENEKPLIDDTLKSIFFLNEEIKEKQNSKLTNALQKRIDLVMGESLKAGGTVFIENIVAYKESLSMPLKQGIVEYFRCNNEKEEFRSEVIKLLKSYKEDAQDRVHLQFQTILGLVGYGQFHESDCSILERWLNGPAKKTVSGKFAELFYGKQIDLIVSLIDHCKEIIIHLNEEDLQKIKKHTSDAILAIPSNSDREQNLRNLEILEKVIGSDYWIPSAKDQMVLSNLKNYRKRYESGSSEAQNGSVNPNVNALKAPKIAPDLTEQITKVDEKKVQSIKVFSKENDNKTKPIDKKENLNKTERLHPGENTGIIKEEINVALDEFNSAQQGAIKNLFNIFRSANLKISKLESEHIKIIRELEFLKRKHEDASVEIENVSKDNLEKERLLVELRERLSSNREDHERKASEWKRLSSEMESQISKVETDLRQVRETLTKKESELDRERKLSHATHSDAVNRSAVELEAKMGAISQSVLPIFKEIDEFLEIEDLPPKARMLLNICRKVKNALQANGVKI